LAAHNETVKLKFDKKNNPDKFCTNANAIKVNSFSYRKIGIEFIEKRFFHKSIFKNVKSIEISLNEIERIYSYTFSDLNFLKYLDLNSNKIKEIDRQAFRKLPNLEYLNLSHNKLEKIDQDLFRGLVSLRIINLLENNLKFSEQNKLKLYLERNITNLCLDAVNSTFFNRRDFVNLRILKV